MNQTIRELMERKSVRAFEEREISLPEKEAILLAAVNAHAAKIADCVAEVVYSIPVLMKGELPCV